MFENRVIEALWSIVISIKNRKTEIFLRGDKR